MLIERFAGRAERVAEMGRRVSAAGACIGCSDCRGLCAELIEALALPEAVARRREET